MSENTLLIKLCFWPLNTHSTLPAYHQTADGHSSRQAAEREEAFSGQKNQILPSRVGRDQKWVRQAARNSTVMLLPSFWQLFANYLPYQLKDGQHRFNSQKHRLLQV